MNIYLKNRIVATLLSFIIIFNCGIIEVRAYETINKKFESEIITKGLVYEHKEIFCDEGWLDVYALIMDLEEPNVDLNVLRSNETFGLREKLGQLTIENEKALAGVNATFFNMGSNLSDGIGITYENGGFTYADQNYNYPANEQTPDSSESELGEESRQINSIDYESNLFDESGMVSLIQNKDGTIGFDKLGVSMLFVTENGDKLYVSGINKIPKQDDFVVYNSNFASDSSQIDASGDFYKLVVVNGEIVMLATHEDTVEIPAMEDGYIIAIPSPVAVNYIEKFQPGLKVNLNINTTINIDNIKMAITGGAAILVDGEIVTENKSLIEGDKRQPRTAVGITKDEKTMVAMVIDGRGSSFGATQEELADNLKEYGVYNAINLDGGGSSTMVTKNTLQNSIEVKNNPSGKVSRKILNGLGFVTTNESGYFESALLKVPNQKTFVNEAVNIEIIAYDQNHNLLPVDYSRVVWSQENIKGKWGEKQFTPIEASEGTLVAYYHGQKLETQIEAIDQVIDISIQPKILEMKYGEEKEFNITGLAENGYKGKINSKDVKFILENDAMGYLDDGIFYAGNTPGISRFTVEINGIKRTGYVAVETEIDINELHFEEKEFLKDSKRVEVKPEETEEIKIFGPTCYRNRLLDEIILKEVYKKMNEADFSIYSGYSDIDLEKTTMESLENVSVWDNSFKEYSKSGIKFIELATGMGSIRETDYTQYNQIKSAMRNATEDVIFVIGSRDPLVNFTDKREGKYLHKLMNDFAKVSGKTVCYLYAGGYENNVTIRDNVRYFELSGLWYKVKDRRVDLNKMFYTLNLYVEQGKFKYMFEPIYPVAVEIE